MSVAPWGVSHVAIIILLFPAGLEDKLGVDASWHGAHSASWSLALSYPRFGAPRCSFSFGRIVVCPEGKRVSAGSRKGSGSGQRFRFSRGRSYGYSSDSSYIAAVEAGQLIAVTSIVAAHRKRVTAGPEWQPSLS